MFLPKSHSRTGQVRIEYINKLEISLLMQIDSRLAELTGIILGDGHLHTKANRITIVGSLDDKEYYEKVVILLFNSVFNQKPTIAKRKDRNAYYLQLESKSIFEIFTKEIGLHRGSKDKAEVPEVMMFEKELIFPLLRGLFDTDGCLKFSKQNTNKNYYPRIEFSFRESPLARKIGELIKKSGFSYNTWKDNRFNGQLYYQISGKDNLNLWFQLIKPNNPVHITKYVLWKRDGFCLPKTSLAERLDRIKNNNNNPFSEINQMQKK